MKYDNLADARQKLAGTFVYYKNCAAYIKSVDHLAKNPEDHVGTLMARVAVFGKTASKELAVKNVAVELDDPELKFMEFNVGYANFPGYAIYYYRVPVKQYKQGFHRNQCAIRDKSGLADPHNYDEITTNDYTAAMLENRYPAFDESIDMIGRPTHLKSAFNKNFAVYRDKLRNDFVIEYKGHPAAFGDAKGTFTCTDNMRWLNESLQEMNIKVA